MGSDASDEPFRARRAVSRRGALGVLAGGVAGRAAFAPAWAGRDRLDPGPPTPDSTVETDVGAVFATDPAVPSVPPDPRLALRPVKLREPVAEVVDRVVPGPGGRLPLRFYRPAGKDPLPIVLHLHGGGWVGGGLANEDDLCRSLAARSGTLVASVGFRLAPEHPFPAALDDCFAALRWLARHGAEVGGDPGRIAISGRSSGGNLAAATALVARDRGGPSLAAQVLLVPATNHNFDTASYHQLAEGDGLVRVDGTEGLTRAAMIAFWDRYLAQPADGADPYASPLRAPDLTGLPPALVVTAQWDPLRDDGEAYAARLLGAGVPVQVTRYLDATHGFLAFAATVPSADRALRRIAEMLRTALAP